jgi:uncharacterized protein (DUF2147 family)
MIKGLKTMLQVAALATVAIGASPAFAAEPTGLWFDHTGRGAVEIVKCGDLLCGRVVWLKDGVNRKACGIQILGNVKPMPGGSWDGGWIYDPEQDAKYSVELTPVGAKALKVVGYMGTKFFRETMMWQRAPADLKRCKA